MTLFPGPSDRDSFANERAALIEEIRRDVYQTRLSLGKATLADRVMVAMASVPRHEFVPPELQKLAYLNRPLPIGQDQTISQPYIVALMSDLAEVSATSKVLEIGTGSGYQAAVLAELVNHVYSIEIIDSLAHQATATLKRLHYENVTVRAGDGYRGWPEHAPFDAIVVTAAPEYIPQPLLDQLKPGGKLVLPVGPTGGTQYLKVIELDDQGERHERNVIAVRFVPLTRESD